MTPLYATLLLNALTLTRLIPISSAFAPLPPSLDVAGRARRHQQQASSQARIARSATSSKGPLEKLGDIVESAAAYAIDAILMSPKTDAPDGMRRVRTQFIAALGDETASSGTGAEKWGIWRVDPGPRGVYLLDYDRMIVKKGGKAPAGWKFDPDEFWIEEYGRIMEKPDSPVSPGRYLVTGGRQVTTILTVFPPDESGSQRWELGEGAKLYDVTHLPCRSARYIPKEKNGGNPSEANWSDFARVAPGAEMPPIPGCIKQDYAVLFVLAIDENV